MKLKTIFTAIYLCAGTFLSCTHESLTDREEENGTTDLSVVFAVEDMKTKTETEIDDELKLNGFFVALYEAETNTFIDSKIVNNPSPSQTTTDKVSAPTYSTNFENIPIGKSGKSVYAVVIANSGLVSLVAGSDIPANTTVTTTTLAPSTLVKAGKSGTVTLVLSTAINKTPTTITVPMTQLAARIDFVGVTVENNANTFTPTRISLSGGNAETLVSIYNNEAVENMVYQKLSDVSKTWLSGGTTSFYTYEYKPGLSLTMTITGNFSDSSQEKTFTLDVSELLRASNLTLTKGHLYKITGECQSTANPTIHWAIVDVEDITVNIPSFN